MKLLALLTLLLALPALATAQCFTAYRDLGNKLVQEKKYDEAIAKYQKGKGCKTDKPADGDKQMDALIVKAKNLKSPPQPKPAAKPAAIKPKPAPGPTEAQKQAEAAAARADDDAWDIAQGTLTGCKRYLDKYKNKNGRHIAAAQQCVRDYSGDDSDSVLNKDDRCPTEKGSAAYHGCPSPKPETEPVPTDPTKCDGCPEMVSVSGGTFTMGCKNSTRDGECYDDEKPPHEVTVRDFFTSANTK
ncbi:MAG: hypothetical protein ABMA02_08990 [Saprospiraceae bacterium]